MSMGSVVQSLLSCSWYGTNNLEKQKLELAMPAKLPIWNQCRHTRTTSCKHYSHILHEMNMSVSIHIPCPRHKNIPLKMTFLVGSFSKDIKERRSHRKSTSFEPLKHVTEEQRGRTDIPDGPWEGNDAGMGLHNCYSCSRSQIMSYKLFWIYLHALCGQQRCFN